MSEHLRAAGTPAGDDGQDRYPFGPEPNQVLLAAWMPDFLTILFRDHRAAFSDVLVKVLGGELPARRRNRTMP